MVGGFGVGVPEIIILVAGLWWLVTVIAAVWALVTLYRLRKGQDAVRTALERIEQLLRRS